MSKIQVEQLRFADSALLLPKRQAMLRSSVRGNVSKYATPHRKPLPRKLVKKVEKNLGVEFKKRPRFYQYRPTVDGRIKKKTKAGNWMGYSSIYFNKKGKPVDAFIMLPEAYNADIKARNIVLEHELVENLAVQHGMHPGMAHNIALQYEKKALKKSKRFKNRQSLYATLKKLHNRNLER